VADDYSASLLIHEVTHVWQYQHRDVTGYTRWKAAAESIEYGRKGAYGYELDSLKSFNQYRFEQQGQMMQDYYMRKVNGRDASAFESIIYSNGIKK